MSNRTWKFVLAGSLLLNAFMLGGIAGGAYQWFSVRHTVAHAPAHGALRFAASGLSPERRAQFIAALKAARQEGREFAREGREGRRDVRALIAAPDFDRAALDAALARTRDADLALRTRVENSVVAFAATLSPDERARFAAGLAHSGQWRQPALLAPHPRHGAASAVQ